MEYIDTKIDKNKFKSREGGLTEAEAEAFSEIELAEN
jgi:hypothetical protein